MYLSDCAVMCYCLFLETARCLYYWPPRGDCDSASLMVAVGVGSACAVVINGG